nr:MAG TPA: hypothetical protein [Bacteriophage sp.]
MYSYSQYFANLDAFCCAISCEFRRIILSLQRG